jgi:hypothetical protein
MEFEHEEFMNELKEAIEKLLGPNGGGVAVATDPTNGIFTVVFSLERLPDIFVLASSLSMLSEMLCRTVANESIRGMATPNQIQ